jgi:hypothetical protein
MTDNPKIKAGQYIDPNEEEDTYQAEYEERINSDVKNLNNYSILTSKGIVKKLKRDFKKFQGNKILNHKFIRLKRFRLML